MSTLATLLEIGLAYAALGLYLGVAVHAARRRDARLGAAVVIAPAALLPLVALPLAYELLLIAWVAAAWRLLGRGDGGIAPGPETKTAFLHLMLASASALFLVPLFWLLLTSLKSDRQLADAPHGIAPVQQATITIHGQTFPRARLTGQGGELVGVMRDLGGNAALVEQSTPTAQPFAVPLARLRPVRVLRPDWSNYPQALRFLPPESRFGLANLQNSLLIAILSVIGTVLSSSLVAYAFARMRWPGKNLLFALVLATMMMPDAVTMMPRFLIFQRLQWYDTLQPLWVPAFFGSAFNIFLLRQFFMGIPSEMEDAAKIDGCGYLATWWRVMMPMVKPALASVAILTFIGSWKDFLGPLIYISSPEKMPVSYVLQLFSTAHGDHPGMLMAATAMVILPIVVIFFFTQRYFVEGISLTGLGGR